MEENALSCDFSFSFPSHFSASSINSVLASREVTARSWRGTSAGCISERLAIDSYKLGHSAFKTSSGSKYVHPILASVI